MRGFAILVLTALPILAQEAACLKCHAGSHASGWRHAAMVREASRQSVAGDFGLGKVTLRGASYQLEQSGGHSFITEPDLTGKPVRHRVEYTLGGRRVQQYMTTLPDGRVIVLAPSWDVQRKQWVHAVDVENPEDSGEDRLQVWNKTCYSCHVRDGRKNFDATESRYRTTWQGLGVDCESCHGPGARHIAVGGTRGTIVNPARLPAERSVTVCASCHAARDIYQEGFEAGQDFNSFFAPLMEFRMPAASADDAAFWADGRPRWFANEGTAFSQSQCFLKGQATCVTCHSGRVAAAGSTCAGCHKAIAADVAKHTHHPPGSAGSACVECHMPATTVGLRTRTRDHSITVPAPENTVRFGIPNACAACHSDKDAAWAAERVTAWFGAGVRGRMMRRAEAFAGARAQNPAAIPLLLAIAVEPSEGPWVRANAVGYLGNFSDDPAAYRAVVDGLDDAEPLVRATAAVAVRPKAAQRAALAPVLGKLLKDETRAVRLNVGIGLVSMGVRPFPGPEGQLFEAVKQLYKERAELNTDQPQQQLAAGKFLFLSGDMEGAAAAFRAALKLDPKIAGAPYLLARALSGKGEYGEARQILKAIPRNDPQYATAQGLLAEVEAKGGTSEAQAVFLEGQVQLRAKFYGAALKAFEQALKMEPKAAWAGRAASYRAICLAKLSRVAEAEAAFAALAGQARGDVELQLAHVELLSETGRGAEALKRVEALIGEVPDAPGAQFWRAKLLLQSGRVSEAAGAAEEAVRLLPEYPEARNLLVRVYQKLGRMKEAGEQAEWLRDYQRAH